MKRTLILGSSLFIFLVIVLIWIISSASNAPPAAESRNITTEEDTPVSITLTGSDPDGDSLSYRIVAKPSHGSLQENEPNLIYVPRKNFNGSDSFTFKVGDGTSESSAAAVSIMVAAINDPPVANDDNAKTREDTPIIMIDVLANDTDVDNDQLFVFGVTQGKNGSVTISTNNMLTYAAKADFFGTDSFNYTISDGKGGTDTATVELTVEAVNDSPVITSKPGKTARVWDSYRYELKAKDPDPGDTLAYSLTNGPEGMTIDPNTGLIEWRPNNEQVGEHEVIVKVTDANNVPASNTQSFTITVTSLSSPLVTPMTVEGGYNHRSGKRLSAENELAIVKASDKKCSEIEAGSSISFDFSDASIPEGAKIVSAVVFVEHFEDKQFPTGKLQWSIGTDWPDNPIVWESIKAPARDGPENIATDSWDITSIVDTAEKIDSLQLLVHNNSNIAGRKTSLDYVYILIQWY